MDLARFTCRLVTVMRKKRVTLTNNLQHIDHVVLVDPNMVTKKLLCTVNVVLKLLRSARVLFPFSGLRMSVVKSTGVPFDKIRLSFLLPWSWGTRLRIPARSSPRPCRPGWTGRSWSRTQIAAMSPGPGARPAEPAPSWSCGFKWASCKIWKIKLGSSMVTLGLR